MNIQQLAEEQRNFFKTHQTFSIDNRISILKKLYKTIQNFEPEINAALQKDLGKCEIDSYMCEIGMTLHEIRYQIKHIRKWNRPKKVATELANFHAKSFTIQEPYGCVLIMSPWNYPFMLTIQPLAGAIAAGNCCMVKPSAYSPATSAVIKKIIETVFPPSYVAVIEGGRAENTELLNTRFDYIFFTGGTTVGKLVMEKAAANLTPVTLELGGKSPCIVDDTCNVKLAAKRIVFGKLLNCGQTCVAPDYVLVDKKVKAAFISYAKNYMLKMYGEKPLENPEYGKMVNIKHFQRVLGLINSSKVVHGGESNVDTLQIAPTILDNVTATDAIMQEEIFGPILPILTYETLDEAEHFVTEREKPLAFYLFTQNKETEKRFLNYVSFGGGCVNDTIVHLATAKMGFGGVGNSGMGSYHGKKSFETFTHEKSILKKYCWIDVPMRYHPSNELYKKAIRLFLH